MPKKTLYELHSMGYSKEDIETAKQMQIAQRSAGAPVQSVATLVGASKPPNKPAKSLVNLTERALRRRGTYDKAALLLDQQALNEKSPERAQKARDAAKVAKELSYAEQLEFDFFGGGNVSIAHQYQDAITGRLNQKAPTPAARDRALSTLWQITRYLGWQTYECTKTAAELADVLGYDKALMARTLKLLEEVGAIQRVKRGRSKIITVTPEGAFRGDINKHGEAVEKYKLEVIEGGRENDAI